jgi:hypothetical protein
VNNVLAILILSVKRVNPATISKVPLAQVNILLNSIKNPVQPQNIEIFPALEDANFAIVVAKLAREPVPQCV